MASPDSSPSGRKVLPTKPYALSASCHGIHVEPVGYRVYTRTLAEESRSPQAGSASPRDAPPKDYITYPLERRTLEAPLISTSVHTVGRPAQEPKAKAVKDPIAYLSTPQGLVAWEPPPPSPKPPVPEPEVTPESESEAAPEPQPDPVRALEPELAPEGPLEAPTESPSQTEPEPQPEDAPEATQSLDPVPEHEPKADPEQEAEPEQVPVPEQAAEPLTEKESVGSAPPATETPAPTPRDPGLVYPRPATGPPIRTEVFRDPKHIACSHSPERLAMLR